MEESILTYLQKIKAKHQQSTVKRYEYDLVQFFSWLKSTGRSFQSIDDLHLYYTYLLDNQRYSKNSIRRVFAVLKQYFLFIGHKEAVKTIEALIQEQHLIRKIEKSDILFPDDIHLLFQTFKSDKGLTDHQKKFRHKFLYRNEMIINLMLNYGLSVQEIANITVNNIHFTSNMIGVQTRKQQIRTISISKSDKESLYHYFLSIPEPIRPNRYDKHAFFIAFDYQRGTYRWNYTNDEPKALSVVAIQKMIRTEMRRAGLKKHYSASSLRKTYIFQQLLSGKSKEDLQKELAFKTTQPLDPYVRFIESLNE
ncbi:tyrosine-type recombinase/integrase [Evansella halocellulosilytica]|uniref:tyrosine-type recombinase/integrase n=1 Tax=Evansella halocellulosilytica TaxID=2011013 RepID=UPI000BB8A0D9|nr:tyrosine-type recombinase/integrase [Evansella halocellulosilytica]